MTTTTNDLVYGMAHTTLDEIDAEQFIPFGCHGRRDYCSDSDTDLVVAEPKLFHRERSRRRPTRRPYRALTGLAVPTAIFLYRHDDADYWCDSIDRKMDVSRGLSYRDLMEVQDT